MIWISHPTGNAFVRALLQSCEHSGTDFVFHTTVACSRANSWRRRLPARLQREWQRRDFAIPSEKLKTHPARELVRLAAQRLGWRALTAPEKGWASIDAVYRGLDRLVARRLKRAGPPRAIQAVHAYEDGARDTFAAARGLGIKCCYELPIAYWQTGRRLLQEEAERWPEWEPTLVGTRDGPAKLERKTEELTLADVVICPSRFVHDSLPESVRAQKPCVVAEFGSPRVDAGGRPRASDGPRPLRLLFAGSMSQRKGLADVFAALSLLDRSDVELVILGAPILPLDFYRRQFARFKYEPPRPHADVLRLMQACDVLVLPSIVEGRALVQQEALSCGLPLIVTRNAGGEDLIEPGQTGFLVPIRAPEQIAEKIAWFADHRASLASMREPARRKAASLTWESYGKKILAAWQRAVGAER